jgi:hypothetical protein
MQMLRPDVITPFAEFCFAAAVVARERRQQNLGKDDHICGDLSQIT